MLEIYERRSRIERPGHVISIHPADETSPVPIDPPQTGDRDVFAIHRIDENICRLSGDRSTGPAIGIVIHSAERQICVKIRTRQQDRPHGDMQFDMGSKPNRSTKIRPPSLEHDDPPTLPVGTVDRFLDRHGIVCPSISLRSEVFRSEYRHGSLPTDAVPPQSRYIKKLNNRFVKP